MQYNVVFWTSIAVYCCVLLLLLLIDIRWLWLRLEAYDLLYIWWWHFILVEADVDGGENIELLRKLLWRRISNGNDDSNDGDDCRYC